MIDTRHKARVVIGRQAVVVGAGLAGLTAARVLADHFEQVIVLEGDVLPASAAHRTGTPQSKHLHGLLPSGLNALNELSSGFSDDLDRGGAVPLRVGLDVRMERPGYDPFPQRDLGLVSRAMSRPLVDLILRQHVSQCANVTLRQRCRVRQLIASPDRSKVTGVQCENADGRAEIVPAELVVDASGRGTLTLNMLRACGLPAPEESTIGVDIAYASAVFEIPDDAPADWKGVMVFGAIPHAARGGSLLPLEDNRWIVSIGEAHSEGLPADADGFLDCVRELRTPTIFNAIKGARRIGAIARFRFPGSVRRHYERLSAFPRGLLPVGDALCRFNPLYGQGMTVAAQQACLINQLLSILAADNDSDPLARLAPTFFNAAQALLETPWAVANFDFIFPKTRGQRPADLENMIRFGMALNRLAAQDPTVHKLMVEVQMLLKPRSVYRDPDLLQRVAAVMASG
jgi:2-polyprenyl-6-methoxyphenol hydroxylase-like FAD-dependent oxidoreductase